MKFRTFSPQLLTDAVELYESAFPEYERRPTDAWQDMIQAPCKYFQPVALTDVDGLFLGFITLWNFPSFVYVEHFAIRPALRGYGLGGRALNIFIKGCGSKPVVLEVEPPETDMARRRIGFYGRHGLSIVPLPYSQPGYRPGAEWVSLSVMATNTEWVEKHFDEVKRTIHKEVYGVEE